MPTATPIQDHHEHFTFLLPPDQVWFSPKEVAAIIGRSDQFVRDAFDNQKFLGHLNNARARRGDEQRRVYQIHREGIVLYLLETANYRPRDFLDRVQEILRNRSREQLAHLQSYLTTRLNPRRAR